MSRDLLGSRSPRRCVGRPAIVRSLLALRLRVGRFAAHRAATPADRAWAAHVLDHLDMLTRIAAGPTFTARPPAGSDPSLGGQP